MFWTIGKVLGHTCFVSGWFMPMYFAGRLESQNSIEYEDAAVFAKELGMSECVADLLDMARGPILGDSVYNRECFGLIKR